MIDMSACPGSAGLVKKRKRITAKVDYSFGARLASKLADQQQALAA